MPERPEVPLLAFIGRLDHQKGVDQIFEAAQWLLEMDVQLVGYVTIGRAVFVSFAPESGLDRSTSSNMLPPDCRYKRCTRAGNQSLVFIQLAFANDE